MGVATPPLYSPGKGGAEGGDRVWKEERRRKAFFLEERRERVGGGVSGAGQTALRGGAGQTAHARFEGGEPGRAPRVSKGETTRSRKASKRLLWQGLHLRGDAQRGSDVISSEPLPGPGAI